jgi:hypothetical protein
MANLCFGQYVETYKGVDPLDNADFKRMVRSDISYALNGEATPTTGLKIDVTKPEGTLSYTSPFGKVLWSLELKGGVTDGGFKFLTGFKNLNSSFELRPSIHVITIKNDAAYGYDPDASRAKLKIRAQNALVNLEAEMLTDSLKVITAIKNYHLFSIESLDFKSSKPSVLLIDTSLNDIKFKRIAIYFMKKILDSDNLGVNEKDSFMKIIGVLSPVQLINSEPYSIGYKEEVSILFAKYNKLCKNLEETVSDKKIKNANEIWTRKRNRWLTFSPFVKAENITAYKTKFNNIDSLYFDPISRYTYGLTGIYNFYSVYPGKMAQLIRISASVSRSSNLATLSTFNYEKVSPLFINGNSNYQKKSTGSAYEFNEVKFGALGSLGFEYYRFPLKSWIPGWYVNPNFNFSNLYKLEKVKGRQSDVFLASFEGGMILNINSKEKDKEKNLLSILLYLRHEDLTDSRRTTISTNDLEDRSEYLKRNLSFGIKVGIPISLPKAG